MLSPLVTEPVDLPLPLYPVVMRNTLLMVAAVAVAVTACTPGDDEQATTTTDPSINSTTQASTTTQPPDGFGGTLRVGINVAPTVLNPFAAGASFDTGTIGNAVWAKVYDVDPITGERVADNITDLPSQTAGGIVDNGDGTITVQYQVARRATWSDGTPMSGADIAFTAEALRGLALSANPSVDPVMASVVETDSVEQVAWITYSESTLTVEDALWIILPSHVVAGQKLASADGLDWPSGGPFMVDGEITSLVRNPNYWKTDGSGRQLPYADALTFVEVFDSGPDAFGKRNVDVISLSPSSENISAIEGLEGDGAELQVAPTPIVEHLTLNHLDERLGSNPASFNDRLDYRVAIAHAIDREALLAESGVPWVPTFGLLDLNQEAWSAYDFNPTESRSLVAGLDATSEPVAVLWTTVNADERPSIAEALTSSFAPIGVGYDTNLQDSILFFQSSLPEATYDLGMWAWVNDGSYSSILGLAEAFRRSNGNGSFSGWAASESDASTRYGELIETASTTIDPAEFRAAIAEAEGILAAELPIIPLFRRTTLAAVWSDTVTGVQAQGREENLTWNTELWQVVGE